MQPRQISAYVLAGGKSTRMGKDKAVLSLHGRTLLETVFSAAGEIAQSVFIVGPSSLYEAFGPVISDIYPGCGPLAGIHAALSHTKTEFNLVLAVDTPFLSAAMLAYLADRAQASGAVVTAPEINAYPQPLCAVYSRAFLPLSDQALRAGNYKIVPLFAKTKTLLIPQSELARFAFTPEMFENLNTPEDLERVSRRIAGGNS